MVDLLRQGQRPHEVGEIVGQDVKLEPDGVVAELAAGQPGPLDGVFAFLDVLLRFASLIVESYHPLGGARQVGDDEADTGITERIIREEVFSQTSEAQEVDEPLRLPG